MYVLIDKLDSLLEESTDSYSIDSIAAYYDETGDTYYYIFNITGVKVLSTGIIDRKSQWGLYVSEGMLSDADGELYFSHQLSEDENPELNEVVKELENSNPIDFYYGFE